ncbi:MAG TPA: hypothetical protein VJK52_03880, partial [Candidatus Nanoarchaeia archaeon]|nr:hypothetical protein [Candidatus Nanoarchaeia archaeon]
MASNPYRKVRSADLSHRLRARMALLRVPGARRNALTGKCIVDQVAEGPTPDLVFQSADSAWRLKQPGPSIVEELNAHHIWKPRQYHRNGFIVEEEVQGPTVFELFRDLSHRAANGSDHAMALQDFLQQCLVADLAIWTKAKVLHDYVESPKSQVRAWCRWTHPNRMVATYSRTIEADLETDLDTNLEEKLWDLGIQLRRSSTFPFRDANLRNYRVSYPYILTTLGDGKSQALVRAYRSRKICFEQINDMILDADIPFQRKTGAF